MHSHRHSILSGIHIIASSTLSLKYHIGSLNTDTRAHLISDKHTKYSLPTTTHSALNTVDMLCVYRFKNNVAYANKYLSDMSDSAHTEILKSDWTNFFRRVLRDVMLLWQFQISIGRDYSQSSSADKEILSTIRRAVTSLLCELGHKCHNSQSSDVTALRIVALVP